MGLRQCPGLFLLRPGLAGAAVSGAVSYTHLDVYKRQVGAGGLGDLAIRYGYNRKVPSMMLVTVIFLIVLVQIIQFVFSRVSNRIDKRLK